jgi:Flp pilus assembly protein TadD
MRFKCQIGPMVQAPPRIVLLEELRPVKVGRATPQAVKRHATRTSARRKDEVKRAAARATVHSRAPSRAPVRALIAGAVLIAAAGCVTTDTKDAKHAKALRVEPVFSVVHANQATQSSAAYFSLGQYYEGTQAWDKSVDAYRKSVAVDANNIEAHNALGVALAQTGRYAEAEVALRLAVSKAPSRTHVRNNLGYVLLLGGKPADAAAELKVAVEQDSNNPIARANLRDAMTRSGQVMELLAEFAGRGTAGKLPAAVEVVASTPAVASSASARPQAAPAQAVRDAAVAVPTKTTEFQLPTMRVGFEPTIAAFEQSPPSPGAAVNAMAVVKAESLSLAMSAPVAVAPVITPAPPPAVLTVVAPTVKSATARLEISNGNGVSGMAARLGKWLATQGLPANRLTNQQKFAQQQTVVQYRSGHEDAAQLVARSLPANAKAEAAPTQGLRSDVRVVIGRDWIQTAACLEKQTCQPAATALAALEPR